MRAVLIDHQPQGHPKLRLVKDYVDPEPPPGEALIRTDMAGICNTDLEIVRGYASFGGVPGHEFVGVVTACDASDWVGRRVVAEINVGCGKCDMCRQACQDDAIEVV